MPEKLACSTIKLLLAFKKIRNGSSCYLLFRFADKRENGVCFKIVFVVLAVLVSAKNEEEDNFVIHDGELKVTQEIDDLVAEMEEQLRAKLNHPQLKLFKAVSYHIDFKIISKHIRGISYFMRVCQYLLMVVMHFRNSNRNIYFIFAIQIYLKWF